MSQKLLVIKEEREIKPISLDHDSVGSKLPNVVNGCACGYVTFSGVMLNSDK